jgi:hypothetical protein
VAAMGGHPFSLELVVAASLKSQSSTGRSLARIYGRRDWRPHFPANLGFRFSLKAIMPS